MGLAREASYLWYSDVGYQLIGKTTTTGSRVDYFNPQDQTIRDLAWDGTHIWAINTSGFIKRFTTEGDLDATISGLISSGWGLTYDGCYLWASDPVKDRIYRIALDSPLEIETDSLPDGTQGVAYTETLLASGGCPPYRWVLSSGSLPDGLEVDSSGLISGEPTTVQISYFTVVVYDSVFASKTKELSIEIGNTDHFEDILESQAPKDFALLQNYPNPFNPTTQIEYTLPCHSHVTLEVYNILGEKVATLVDEKQETGYKRARWDAGSFSSGSYFYRLRTGEYEMTRRMVLLR